MNTTHTVASGVQQEIEEILGLNEMSLEEQQQFLESVGALVIESAVLKFVVSVMPSEREMFEAWLESHQKSDTLLEEALVAYPAFAEILTEEMEAFQSESKRFLGIVE